MNLARTFGQALPEEFSEAFESSYVEWLHRRVRTYCIVVLVVTLAITLWSVYAGAGGAPAGDAAAERSGTWIPVQKVVLVATLRSLIVGAALLLLHLFGARMGCRQLIILATMTFIAVCFAQIVVIGEMTEIFRRTLGMPFLGFGIPWMAFMLVLHIITAIFVPWRVRDALMAMMPFAALGAIVLWLGLADDPLPIRIALPFVIAGLALPGMAIAFVRTRGFRQRFHLRTLDERYGALRRELESARRIHEAVFPGPITAGPLLFRSAYEPANQIGGDFVFVTTATCTDGTSCLNAMVIDVTGHGIAAALTVNRLYGELRRLYAERPMLPPGEALAALNRYMLLTLTSEGIFATALCLQATTGQLRWANAGHPEALLLTDGDIARLESSAPMLGIMPESAFERCEQSADLEPGSAVVVCTDGVTETELAGGSMLGAAGWRALVRAVAEDAHTDEVASRLRDAVAEAREGPARDDTLVVVVASGDPSPG